ncbi:EscU/YscU/HrcU family type III secretion system export apparatus switch protein [Gynuella sp.]|uniref:EscU/YscU/HrcU family type III secretion system export apparatus switch protein n=1 Tax=Gynuella sp. TaxID=2969146 RepID=UPI003D144F62
MNQPDPQSALALHYNGKDTPTVVATGQGELAEEILRLAREYEVPVLENKELLAMLTSLDIGQAIPDQLFEVIAEIIAMSYWLRGRVPEGFNSD